MTVAFDVSNLRAASAAKIVLPLILVMRALVMSLTLTESVSSHLPELASASAAKDSAHDSVHYASFIAEPRERHPDQGQVNGTSSSSSSAAGEFNSVSAIPAQNSVDIKQYNFGDEDYVGLCPSLVECFKLGGECINCAFNKSCVYGANVTVKCTAKRGVQCTGPPTFDRLMVCQYCYQSEPWEHSCSKSSSCRVASNPRERFLANCTVNSDITCLGNRTFQKYFLCNWTGGYKWSTALILSVTLGGFGVDRFYLGHWQEGIGKLFSFGGLGVWTLLDVLLIAVGYLGPADGSLYI